MDDQQKKDIITGFIDLRTSSKVKDALSFLTED
jgi:hypothetical protein